MKPEPNDKTLNRGRRHWLAWAVAMLTGCGGGSDGGNATMGNSTNHGGPAGDSASGSAADGGTNVAGGAPGTGGTGTGAQGSMPGTGGTGVFSHGAIRAFGSIVVNGVHFDETHARITIDGASASRSALRLGMVAGIDGERYADGLTGRADNVSVMSIARGQVSTAGGGQFSLLGMSIRTSGSTFVEGLSSAAAVSAGQWVLVWGLQADVQANAWDATRVAVISPSEKLVATGIVKGSRSQWYLNGIPLTGDHLSDLAAGMLVRVSGTWDSEHGALKIESVSSADIRSESGGTGAQVEIEGVVTSLRSGNHFILGSIEVDGSSLGARYSVVRVGATVEVYGYWMGSILKATEIEAEDD